MLVVVLLGLGCSGYHTPCTCETLEIMCSVISGMLCDVGKICRTIDSLQRQTVLETAHSISKIIYNYLNELKLCIRNPV